MKIRKVNQKEGFSIIENRSPKGLFYYQKQNAFVGNSSGDAFVEEFTKEEDCLAWLRGGFEILVDQIKCRKLHDHCRC